MRDAHDAMDRACAEVGIRPPPRGAREGHWTKTDTLDHKGGRGDGRVILNDTHVTAWNWKTGEKATVRIGDDRPVDRRAFAARLRAERRESEARAAEAARKAGRIVAAATLGTHPYLAAKGFPKERVPVVLAAAVVEIGGRYLVPESGERAIVIPASVGGAISSAQLIWEDGQKKFVFGGRMEGASHRIVGGRDTWLCEGFATGLSLRAALRAMNRSDRIIMCFSASNLPTIARTVEGPCWIAADHDKPMPQFAGLGAGEHYARLAGRPYAMPADVGDDINDLHLGRGIFAVQRILGATIRGASA